MTHELTIANERLEFGPDVYVAKCSCGWQCERQRERDARREFRKHFMAIELEPLGEDRDRRTTL